MNLVVTGQAVTDPVAIDRVVTGRAAIAVRGKGREVRVPTGVDPMAIDVETVVRIAGGKAEDPGVGVLSSP